MSQSYQLYPSGEKFKEFKTGGRKKCQVQYQSTLTMWVDPETDMLKPLQKYKMDLTHN